MFVLSMTGRPYQDHRCIMPAARRLTILPKLFELQLLVRLPKPRGAFRAIR